MQQLIDHIKHYVPLQDEEIPILLSLAKTVQVKKKHYFLQEGQVCQSLYFVQKGCLRLYFVNSKGTEQITQFAIENWWMADFMSYGSRQPSPFYIQAVEASEVVMLEHTAQEKLLSRLPQMERYFRIMLQKAYAASQLRLKYLYDLSKEESYRHFISSFPGFAQRVPQYMLASYLDLTPEYLSEIRKRIS